jgi:hypothetical protein
MILVAGGAGFTGATPVPGRHAHRKPVAKLAFCGWIERKYCVRKVAQ